MKQLVTLLMLTAGIVLFAVISYKISTGDIIVDVSQEFAYIVIGSMMLACIIAIGVRIRGIFSGQIHVPNSEEAFHVLFLVFTGGILVACVGIGLTLSSFIESTQDSVIALIALTITGIIAFILFIIGLMK